MTKDKLQRGNEIDRSLGMLNSQLNKLKSGRYTVLEELRHPCSNKVEGELEDLELSVCGIITQMISNKIKALEKEFKSL